MPSPGRPPPPPRGPGGGRTARCPGRPPQVAIAGSDPGGTNGVPCPAHVRLGENLGPNRATPSGNQCRGNHGSSKPPCEPSRFRAAHPHGSSSPPASFTADRGLLPSLTTGSRPMTRNPPSLRSGPSPIGHADSSPATGVEPGVSRRAFVPLPDIGGPLLTSGEQVRSWHLTRHQEVCTIRPTPVVDGSSDLERGSPGRGSVPGRKRAQETDGLGMEPRAGLLIECPKDSDRAVKGPLRRPAAALDCPRWFGS